MQKTTIVDQFGAPLYRKPQLVIASLNNDGSIDLSNIQPLNDWNFGMRNSGLVAHAHGYDLMTILSEELGLVDVNDEGFLYAKIIVTSDPNVSVMRLLGKIAEAMVVKECNESVVANRLWGMYARKGKIPHKSLDSFRAIGTGLNSTQRLYPTKYNPTDPQRDVIWINKENEKEELLQITNNSNCAIIAGIQLKVSTDGFRYIFKSDIARGKYEVPLVYFDLSNDYYKLTNAIYDQEFNVGIGTDIVRGRDISISIHELLLSYYSVIHDLVMGKMTIDQIIKDELLFDVFKKEVQEQKGMKIISI
ncbi:hypothetical protein [Klebsiella pneumoniae]|uniref:hypothetical protein n=1 Tax=Klebsiella pneumoniae TaxID=573 RepID=UPI0023800409|nr:hypothetical protein [Klebsiella pneumoniae]MDE4728641.1 hypothetical protein [Klebsiella pneumoniae]